MKNLLFDFLKVTEQAAISTLPWIGSGNKNKADEAATSSMRNKLNALDIEAEVVIGEGEMDNAPMLFIGELLGKKGGPKLDVAVDPLDGTRLIANGERNGLAVIAVAPKGSLLHAPDMYMKKIIVGPKVGNKVHIDDSIHKTLKTIQEVTGKDMSEITVAIQNRDRHNEIIKEVRATGAKVQLFEDGDILFSIAPAIKESNIDLFVGIGGAPEGVTSAVAIKSLGGFMQAQLIPYSHEEFSRCQQMGIVDPEQVMELKELVNSKECFFIATGVTDGLFIDGVKKVEKNTFITSSIVTNGIDKSFQIIKTYHEISDKDETIYISGNDNNEVFS